jgi:hypothetical protein
MCCVSICDSQLESINSEYDVQCSNNCNNNGICYYNSTVRNYSCICNMGFQSPNCSIQLIINNTPIQSDNSNNNNNNNNNNLSFGKVLLWLLFLILFMLFVSISYKYLKGLYYKFQDNKISSRGKFSLIARDENNYNTNNNLDEYDIELNRPHYQDDTSQNQRL